MKKLVFLFSVIAAVLLITALAYAVNHDFGDLCGAGAASCTVDDLCPCDAQYKNHGQYVSCVAHAATALVQAGYLDKNAKGAVISGAILSECGGGGGTEPGNGGGGGLQ